ncbi:hypothetical protein PROFUN_10592 [Planoprotostelium fungivorum]|uniref:Glucose-methanol-choline oxidoreductase N-terminal domain-containing protein n=1 Tax=Planoprotostelium fungivorum TaxID=1890364 RepID=A0A2P6ND13_9EUKA|nr:hypothetical protein PROFUN_10592 [Planoprotostelium fungivorum]
MNRHSLLILLLLLTIVTAQYDMIFVGLGTASSITLTKLAKSFPNLRFLAFDYGGPLAKANGGSNVPYYFDGSSNPQTIFDVPGEYQAIAWADQGAPYRITETLGWQGKGYGGNSQFNGMLFQQPPAWYLDNLPQGWRTSDLSGTFTELRSKMKVTPTPSKDNIHYLDGIFRVMKTGFDAAGFTQADTSNLAPLQGLSGYYSVPYVVTDGNAQRGGTISGYLKDIIGTNGQPLLPNVQVINGAQVRRILFGGSDVTVATGVEYVKNGATLQVSLNTNGRVVVGAGAQMTPRLLYMSGIGPSNTEGTVFSYNPNNVRFVRANSLVGTSLYDHVGVNTAIEYNGATPVQVFDYPGKSNTSALNDYVNSRVGAFSQYGPVVVSHFKTPTSSYPDVELFVNPNGPGGPSTYNGPTDFQAVLMLMNPTSKGSVRLDSNMNIQSPGGLYLNDNDVEKLTDALYLFANTLVAKTPNLRFAFGPGGKQPNSFSTTDRNSIRNWVRGQTIDGLATSGFIMNHYTGTVPLQAGSTEDVGGVTPDTLRLRGTKNVHVVDASILPASVPCHPVAVIMAIGAKGADLLANALNTPSISTTRQSTTATPTTSVTPTTTVTPSTTSQSSSLPIFVYYPFETLTPNTPDRSGNNRYGVPKGSGLSSTTGKYGNALKLVQSSQLSTYQVNNGQGLTGQFTVATWLNIPAAVDVRMKIASSKVSWFGSTGWQLEHYPTMRQFSFVSSGDKVANWANLNVPYGSWFHVAVAFNGADTAELFFNGVSQGTRNGLSSVLPAAEQLFVGSDNTQPDGVIGAMDEFVIFSKRLSSAEVTQVYNNNFSGTSSTGQPSSTVQPTSSSRATSSTAQPTSSTAQPTSSSSRATSSTALPTTSSVPTTTSSVPQCPAGTCGAASCCPDALRGNMCYSPSTYTCGVDKANGKVYLCGAGAASCNSVCYDTTRYNCVNGNLAPK